MAKIVRPTDAISPRPLILTIFSDPGVGKTSVAFTARRPILLAYEQGVERSYADGRGTYFEYKDWDENKREIKNGEFKQMILDENASTVIIDTVGTLIQSQITDYVKSLGGKLTTKGGSALSMDGWGKATDEFVELTKAIKTLNVDMICLAHAKGDGKEQKQDVDVQGQTKGMITKHSDIIAYMFTDGRGQRWIEFDGTEDRVGKNPGRLKKMAIPTCATKGEYVTFLEDKVIAPTKEAMFGQTLLQKEAITKLDAIKNKIDDCEKTPDCEKLIPLANELPSSLRFAALTLIFDKAVSFYKLGSIKTASKMTEGIVELGQTKELMTPALFDYIKSAFSKRYQELGLK